MIRRIFNIVSLSLLIVMAASCQKENDVQPLDYSVQVIPDIGVVLEGHHDLIAVMDSLNLLHFGDNPPKLFTIDTTDGHQDTLGFCNHGLIRKKFIKADPASNFEAPEIIFFTYQFLFNDQHKGVSALHFRSPKQEDGPDNHFIETATCLDSVFIMGEKPFFTAYFIQETKRDLVMYGQAFPDPLPKQAVILSGQVTDDGIKDFYIGIKVFDYGNAAGASFTPGFSGFNIGDIAVHYKDFMPFTYWEPD